MSDPIQSISQQNFLLATQQEVSHDASLSGNGTVESPLGVANNSGIVANSTIFTGTVTGMNFLESSYYSNGIFYLNFHFNPMARLNTSTNTLIGTIASDYRPKYDVNFPYITMDSNLTSYGLILIKTNGEVYNAKHVGGNANVGSRYGTVAYPIQ